MKAITCEILQGDTSECQGEETTRTGGDCEHPDRNASRQPYGTIHRAGHRRRPKDTKSQDRFAALMTAATDSVSDVVAAARQDVSYAPLATTNVALELADRLGLLKVLLNEYAPWPEIHPVLRRFVQLARALAQLQDEAAGDFQKIRDREFSPAIHPVRKLLTDAAAVVAALNQIAFAGRSPLELAGRTGRPICARRGTRALRSLWSGSTR